MPSRKLDRAPSMDGHASRASSINGHAASERAYVGEISNLKRHGYGIYKYENAFFKYEGEWYKGLKHGRGRLVMNDGSYYDGEFQNGEIEGRGFKYFAATGAKYTGDFHNGDLHGDGVMQYQDGSQYDGKWVCNKRHGVGSLRTSEEAAYTGTFYGNMRHGEGTQTYENGDWYKGGWLFDKREGYGEFHGADGTSYVGQWKSDQYFGEGRMEHCSGFIYEGEWFNGHPTSMATKLVILVDPNPMEIESGDKFSIKVECQNERGDIITRDNGRELQILAGFQYVKPPPDSSPSLFDMIEDAENTPIQTPFGYDVVPYPLTEYTILLEEEQREMAQAEAEAILAEAIKAEEQALCNAESNLDPEGNPIPADQTDQDNSHKSKEEAVIDSEVVSSNAGKDKTMESKTGNEPKSSSPDQQSIPNKSSAPTTNQLLIPNTESAEQVVWKPLPQPPNIRTISGSCEWTDIVLAPPPPLYSAINTPKITKTPKNIKDKNKGAPPKKRRNEEYVIMVSDITAPRFMEKSLESAFLLLKIKPPKKYIPRKEPKPKWDTSKHISAMMRNAEEEENSEDV